jgi:hypothetical protein
MWFEAREKLWRKPRQARKFEVYKLWVVTQRAVCTTMPTALGGGGGIGEAHADSQQAHRHPGRHQVPRQASFDAQTASLSGQQRSCVHVPSGR